jgi:hypothetical protein
MKSDNKQVFSDIVYFDLIYHSEKKREKNICQGFSKNFV